nr:Holliday junction resolvase RecU [Scopulibacillus darangshiensis]
MFYPNGKPYLKGKPKQGIGLNRQKSVTYGNRGMTLEEDINISNQYYLTNDIAVIHKKPTPVQIVNVDYPKRSAAKITEAYFKKASTTDYNGLYKGKYIDFEAKETRHRSSLPLKNFHGHQVAHMKNVQKHSGICFIIVKFSSDGDIFLLDAGILVEYWDLQHQGGRKSIPKAEVVRRGHSIPSGYLPRIDYLKVLNDVYL